MFVRILGAFFICYCWIMNSAMAFDEKTPSIEKIDLLPHDEFIEQMQVFEDTPMNDETLAYRLYLPKDWTNVATDDIGNVDGKKISLDILGNIARFFGPAQLDDRSFFTIQALSLDYDITMEGWFVTFARNNGYSIEAIDIVSEQEVQALYVEVRNGESFRVRLSAKINGERIIVARFFVPQQRYGEEKAIQEQVIQNFTLTTLQQKVVDTRSSYGFLDQSHFNYPKTWELNAKRILSIERMRAEIRDMSPSGDLNARIRVHAISRLLGTGLNEEIKSFMEGFNVQGYRLGSVIERHNFKHHQDMDFAKTEVYELTPDSPFMLQYELWATILQNDDYYYIVTLLVPTRDQEFFTWSQSAEVYKIVLATLRRYE